MDRTARRKPAGRVSFLRAVGGRGPRSELGVAACSCAISLLFLLGAALCATGHAAPTVARPEYAVKAAFLVNFVKFCEWPEDRMPPKNKPLIIGIIGEDPFKEHIEPLLKASIQGRKCVLKRFGPLSDNPSEDATGSADDEGGTLRQLAECHVLFIASSEKKHLKRILGAETRAALTIGDVDGFLDAGGMVNFLVIEGKVRFEVNGATVKASGLKLPSRVLRLAHRVL